MLADPKELFYSVNAGETWTSLDLKGMSTTLTTNIAPPIIMLDANTFYIGSTVRSLAHCRCGQVVA